MCLIVDINVAEAVLLKKDDPDFKVVRQHLLAEKAPRALLAIGGMLAQEYAKNRDVARIVLALDRAGRTRTVPNDAIEVESEALRKLDICLSNDIHILALARAGRVRLLCSRDQDLHSDFCNKAILDNPRGKVYSAPSHDHLIVEFCKDCPFCNLR